ncbi:hypothetical protein Ctaglu_21530 [Clostridium tagluense]|uniref:Uncharacterized protein n=1 Tax=Clostridium tagluense TaxID=360422 RepID=A0A401ULX1_9CLOT|nr:hypothetical protein Ctaglu_21530 [Clostridium tagluense]
MAEKQEQFGLVKESDEKWNQYKMLQIAALCSFIFIFIPLLGILYIIGILVASIMITIGIMGFIKRCNEILNTFIHLSWWIFYMDLCKFMGYNLYIG